MNLRNCAMSWCLAMVLLGAGLPDANGASGYSHSGHSYSSHSSSSHSSSYGSGRSSGAGSRSSGGGGSKSFSSGSGKNYSSGSNWNSNNRKGYSSSKSYSSDSGKTFKSSSPRENAPASAGAARQTRQDSSSSGFSFDTAAARARKEEASKSKFTEFKQSQTQPQRSGDTIARPDASSYRGQPPPIAPSRGGSYRRTVYVPDEVTISTRPIRIYNVYNSYRWRPWITYNDPYSSLFWWWLLDRTIEDRAWWAYHHRYDMDPARYEALMATDAQLQARVAQLEAQQAARDPNYVPSGLEGRDLMYSDQYVSRSYRNRPTAFGRIAFWVFGVPTACGLCAFFIWLIWFKRWQTAT